MTERASRTEQAACLIRLEGELRRELNLPRISHPESQETRKVKECRRRQRVDVVLVVESVEHLDHRDQGRPRPELEGSL